MGRQRSIARGIVVLIFASGMAGCEAAGPLSPTLSPSPIPQTPPPPVPLPVRRVELAVFTDSATGFSTSDVYDVHEEIVRFNTADELIWIANDARFPEFIVDGMFISYHHKADHFLQVRFGTRDGKRQAYLSWPGDRRTIADLWVDERDLKIAETTVPVPGT